jgi:hypothetical protein
MKHLSAMLFILISFQLTGQDNFYPDYFERQPGTRQILVKTDCSKCKPIQKKEHTGTYVFNADGFNIEWYGVYRGLKSGMYKFFWNADGTIAKYQNYSTYTGSMSDEEPTADNDYGMIWDSTRMGNEVRYTYDNNKIKAVTWMDGEELAVTSVMTFYYDVKWRRIKEETVDYPAKNDFSDKVKPTRNSKLYRYSQDSVSIEYYKSGQLSGRGKQKVDESNHLTFEATFNLKGKLIFEIKNSYNDNGQLIEQYKFVTGFDGYGYESDEIPSGRYKFEYDTFNRLKRKIQYNKGIITAIHYYDYK